MPDELRMSKEEALEVASDIKKISVDNENAIKTLELANKKLKAGWQSEAQIAYEECFVQMKNKLATYSDLLADYSDTLTKVVTTMFETDAEFANNIRAKYMS